MKATAARLLTAMRANLEASINASDAPWMMKVLNAVRMKIVVLLLYNARERTVSSENAPLSSMSVAQTLIAMRPKLVNSALVLQLVLYALPYRGLAQVRSSFYLEKLFGMQNEAQPTLFLFRFPFSQRITTSG